MSVTGAAGDGAPPADKSRTLTPEERELLKKSNVFVSENEPVSCDQEGMDNLNLLLKHLKDGTPLTDVDNRTLAAMQNSFPDWSKIPVPVLPGGAADSAMHRNKE
jgi:hypothetical protein